VKSSIKTRTLILLCVVLFTVLTSVFLLAHTAEHDCIGDGCPVCTVIAACLQNLKNFGKAAALAFALFSVFAAVLGNGRTEKQPFFRFTPISLKVKLTD